MVETEKKKIATQLESCNGVAITTDMWSSCTQTSFLAVTAHFISGGQLQTKLLACERFQGRHTAEKIKEQLLEALDSYRITDKIVCTITDSAANMKKAIVESGQKWIPCYAHCLNLAVNEALSAMPGLEETRKKISALVTFLHQSNNGKEDFERCKQTLSVTRSLIQDVKTRWNSTYLLLQRFVELKQVVVLYQTTETGKDYTFSQEEWNIADSAAKLLRMQVEAV